MGLLRTLLSAISYPGANTIVNTEEHSCRQLVKWLENMKIRQYATKERKRLDDVGSLTWPAAFSQYLEDLECPITLSETNQQDVLEWLASFAVSLEYADHADEYQATAAQGMQQQQQEVAGQAPFPDLHSQELQQQLRTLFTLLHVDTSHGTLLDHLKLAREVLSDSILPSTTDVALKQAATAGSLEQIPLGFQTGDAQVDELATVLRLLYIKDLRQLQTSVDRMVVQVQEYTANPKTDASLGKVGH